MKTLENRCKAQSSSNYGSHHARTGDNVKVDYDNIKKNMTIREPMIKRVMTMLTKQREKRGERAESAVALS